MAKFDAVWAERLKKIKRFNYGEIKVIPITVNLVDIFWGVGFDGWARFKWNGKQWDLWNKNKPLPNNYLTTLETYRKEIK